ncbi:DUF1003 domain-containing protein [Phormidium sp. CLA17]|uniref:DUF1003 domain-containing protein n=1 Tax=Leptolyngbya sp. Cla-17 TaxID=2803751 RepID=UPI0018D9BC62|nr:DUF1003 domain-containing protein [Leptolyngbya sp. Cla-17]MBM0743057.1 DUF1003 domain-containing protein [Leptolyngbya sp. Cla-17]
MNHSPNPKTRPKKILTAPLPAPVTKNIEAILAMHNQEVRDLTAHQRVIEAIAKFFGQPAFLYVLVAGFAIWITGSLFNPILPFTFPPFHWSDHGLDAAALLISTGVLIEQSREENFAEQRTQLMLQLNLLSEQKIAKIIAMLEELRTDLPDVRDRHDPEATIMQEAADPIAVLNALQESLQKELAEDEIAEKTAERSPNENLVS